MSEDNEEDFEIRRIERQTQERLSETMGFKSWFQSTFGKEPDKLDVGELQPFSLRGSTAKQEQALRDLAREYGFENMRGFNKFMQGAHVDYYDLIKVASP